MNCEKAEIDRNLGLMRDYISAGRAAGADIVCFPEMNVTGYIDPGQYPDAVLSLEHPAIERVVSLSGEYATSVIAGFVEANPGGKPYINQFVASDGKLLGFYRKKTIKEGEENWFAPGDGRQPVFTVSGLAFGLAICADIDDPAIFAQYAGMSAAAVFECAAPGLYGEQETRNWSSGHAWWRDNCWEKLGKYAAEGALYIGVATQAGRTKDEDFPGGGYLFGPRGERLAESGDWAEGVLYAEIPIQEGTGDPEHV
ncbi:carbon-nitrogen hydrolase family protein [Paenibacillus sp. IB182493]|uniref:Carbon-nitrogen hydrolase family protein n=2 Tax=Paenibacillus arenilitoris TaxID=2772299 RepID=A0A927HA54_9BACL|nr:carbon-nitrogen hydrolase family protein [Paenibacillus arenilitoris]